MTDPRMIVKVHDSSGVSLADAIMLMFRSIREETLDLDKVCRFHEELSDEDREAFLQVAEIPSPDQLRRLAPVTATAVVGIRATGPRYIEIVSVDTGDPKHMIYLLRAACAVRGYTVNIIHSRAQLRI